MRNLTMMTDLYQLTMMYGYFKAGKHKERAVYDLFFRRQGDETNYAVCAGLEQVIDLINNLRFEEEDIKYLRSLKLFDEEFMAYLRDFRFTGEIYAMPEGTVVFPMEPLVRVSAPISEAQLVETALLNIVNHQTLIATKASRVVYAAQGDPVLEFGLRRAQGPDAGIYGARAAIIGGCDATSNVLTGQMYDIPIKGTHAHSWVMSFPTELDAFRAYADIFPDSCLLLVDTYDTLESGVPNAIRVFDELRARGHEPVGIRLDSGDLAYLSKKSRAMLDEAGLTDCRIVASNSLDEMTISSLLSQGAKIDIFGVGERLITARSEPVFGAVYKLVAVEENGRFVPRIKISENVEKVTNPGLKRLLRVYDQHGKSVADLLTLAEEPLPGAEPYRFVDPVRPWRIRHFENCRFEDMQVCVFKGGKLMYQPEPLNEVRAYVQRQLSSQVWEEEQRFENPHVHYVDMSPRMYELKMSMLDKARG